MPLFFGWVRSRIKARRRFDVLRVAAAIFILTLGFAPLAHELTALAIRPKPKPAAGPEPVKATVVAEPPSVLPILAGLGVIVAGLLSATVAARSLSPWDDSTEALRAELRKQLLDDGCQKAALWWLESIDETDDGEFGENLRVALGRHYAVGFAGIAPVRAAGVGVLSAATFLAAIATAAAFAIHLNTTALPAAAWLAYAKLAKVQTEVVVQGGISAVPLIVVAAATLIGLVGFFLGWFLGRALPASPVPELAASPESLEPMYRKRVSFAVVAVIAMLLWLLCSH